MTSGINENGGDELVFLAGSAGGCNVSTFNWPPGSGLDNFRYRIQISDNGETGCVYLYRRTEGSHPAIDDLIEYDPVGDGEAGTPEKNPPDPCRPEPTSGAMADACGAIIAQAHDVDGDGLDDMPAYRIDYLGNWTIDKWYMGEPPPR